MFARLCLFGILGLVIACAQTPSTPVRNVVDEYHGVRITDPYRWMEDSSSPEVTAWLRSQAEYTNAVLSHLPGRDRIAARLNEVLRGVPHITFPVRRADLYFYFKLVPDADVPKLYVREGLGGGERLLVDPEKHATAGTHFAIDYFEPSPDGTYVAYGLSTGGSENSVLHVLETASGRDLGELISRATAAGPQWRRDGKSFLYWREAKRAPGAPPHTRYLNSKTYLHVLGRNPDEDPAVFGRGVSPGVEIAESDWPMVFASPDASFALGIVAHGTQMEVSMYIAPVDTLTGPGARWKKVAGREDAIVNGSTHGDELYFLTHRGAPRFKLIRLSASNPDPHNAEVIVPPGEAVLTNVVTAKDALYVQELDGGTGRLLRVPYGPRAKPERVPLPFDGSIRWIFGDPRQTGVLIMLASWTKSPALYSYDPAFGKLVDTGLQPPNPVDMSDYEYSEIRVRSHDGTLVPLSIVSRKGLKRHGSAPAILDGYGAYGVSMEPAFLGRYVPWLERGGIVAIAHARGGGEYGKEWHTAGQKGSKPNTFLDAIACAEYLIENGYTSSKRLAIQGTSAGGIFAGGAITERPDLFGAAVIRVGVADMLRSERSESGPANVAEFGSTNTPEGFKALLAMSPYHRVKDNVAYPAVLLTTGVNDPRVPAWEPGKMAARLQAASSSGRPVLLRVDYDAGHGFGSTQSQNISESADIFAFLLSQFNR